MARFISRLFQAFSTLLATFFALAVLAGCSGILSGQIFKERAAETPAPEDMNVDKSFFVDPNGKAKTFLCAYAAEVTQGWGEYLKEPFVNENPHCNAEWEITEHELVAKRIDPSYPDDRSRWPVMFSIPIEKHFYYERNKDPHGRETNEWIENSSRSHWSARPKMKLNFQSSNVVLNDGPFSYKANSIDNIEWDKEKNFLGFTMHTTVGLSFFPISMGDAGVTFRVNFLQFEHDPTFKKIPYNEENAKFMNVLHVMGRTIEGQEKDLYAAHWDLRQTNRIYISAPKEYQNALVAAVYKWNDEFVKIGAIKPGQLAFAPVVKDLKHPFDLRYPSITWIADRKISLSAPLGIGMAHADVRNGKILWGGVVLFGGILESYINSWAPIEVTPGSSGKGLGFGLMDSLTSLFPKTMPAVSILDPNTAVNRSQALSNGMIEHKNFLSQEIARLSFSKDKNDNAKGQALKHQLETLQSQDPGLNKIASALDAEVHRQSGRVADFNRNFNLQSLFNPSAKQGKLELADAVKANGNSKIADAMREKDLNKRKVKLVEASFNGSSVFVEREMTVENKVGSWMQSPAQKLRNYNEILDSIVASLIVHELGHVMGLGHQFKENIVPEAGTVPSRYIKELSAKATPEKEFTNMTSVMGYQSGRTEMMTPASEYNPGPQDDLVLRYIYKGEYAAYDKQKDDWVFFPVPDSGKIPLSTQTATGSLPTSYFPQCNDIDASYMADPFCNRFDRGSKAEDIVNSYFEIISDNILASMYSLVGASGNREYAEWRLWYRSFDAMSRVRLFYDEMRRRLRSDNHLKPLWAQLRNDSDALFEFSKACTQSNPTDPAQVQSPVLRQIFADPAMVDLCRANGQVLKEFDFFMNLPESDYTRIDHNNRYVLGGYLAGDAQANYGHMFGSWYQMTNLPLKLSSMYTLTTSDSYLPLGYLFTNPYYDTEENRFQYRTLYPIEYTRMVSKMVENNMRFAAGGKDDTTVIGRPVLAAGSMLPWTRYTSNDSARLPREFDDMLNQQSHFNYSMVAVLIEAVKPDASSNTKADHYKKFTASVYDFYTNKSTSARDVYLLPNGDVFVWANGMFIFPITKIKFYSGTSSYVIAYKVDYDQGPRDVLFQDSLKAALTEKNNNIGDTCITGFDSNGLQSYFDTANPNFEGFKILSGIAEETGNEKLGAFYDSLKEEFDKYETTANKKIPAAYPIKSMSRVCEESIRGMGQISAAAAITNGFFLGITPDYLEK